MEHAINQLKEDLINMIKLETMEFKSFIETLTAHSEKVDSSLANLSKESDNMKKDSA